MKETDRCVVTSNRLSVDNCFSQKAPRKDYTQVQIRKAIEAVRKEEQVQLKHKIWDFSEILFRIKSQKNSIWVAKYAQVQSWAKKDENILVRWSIALFYWHIPMTKDKASIGRVKSGFSTFSRNIQNWHKRYQVTWQELEITWLKVTLETSFKEARIIWRKRK